MSKSKVSGKKLIIQLGRDETLLALWDKGPQFLYTTSVPTPEGAVEDGEIRNADAVREMLQAALEAPEFQNVRNAIYSLCTSRVITETVTTPEMPAKKLGKLIQANIDMYFPVDMTDYRLVWQTIGPKTSSTGMKELLVQLWAVPNSILGPYYAVANACGLSVAAIDYCGNSIATAVGASFAMDGKGTKKKARKIDLNKDISLGRKKEALPDDFSPAMPEPGNNGTTDLHLTLEKDLIGVTFVQANRVVHQRFILTGNNPAYQFEEVAMMVEYFSSLDVGRGSTINGMVSGYLADNPHFVDELSEALDMPLSAFQAEFNPCWVICAGAAQTKLDFGNPDLNNAPKSVDTAATRVYHTAALAAGGAALAGVVALTFVARLSWDATLEALEARRMTLAIQAQKVAGYADKYNEYATLYDNYSNDWNIIFNSLRTYNDNLVRVMEELESILPEKTSVTALAIGNDGLNVQFACENKEEAAYLIMALRELQYADLTAISSLSGGGRGAANSYGNGEQAPTEGGIFVSEDVMEELGELFTKDFAPYNITSSLSSGQIQNMETNYGYLPETDIILDDGDETTPVVTHDCKTIAELEKVYSGVLNPGGSITADMRAAAIQNTLKTNPFSSYWFVKELKVDYNINSDNPMSIDRSKLFFWDLIGMYGYFEDNYGTNPLSYKTPEDAERVMTYFSDKICTTNDPNDSLTQEERVAETERLFKRNATLEQWYVYYLQEEINKDAEADTEESDIAVYLDMQAILDDVLVDGKFSSTDSVLNEGLTKLMSDETKAAVEKNIVAAPEVTPTPTPTPTAVIPTLKPTDNPTPTPSTSPTITPTPTNKPDSTLPGGITVEMVEEQLVKYADTGKTDYYPILDSQLDKYVTTGKTDYPEIDAALNAYIASGEGDELAKIMVKDYLENGKFGNETLNEAIDQYSKTGTTGNKVIDDRIEDFMESEEAEQIISDLLNDYIADGKTDYPYLDSMIEAYITKGTTGKPGFDKLIEKGMDDFARERWPNQTVVNTLLDKTKTSGKSGDSVFDLLYARYRIMKTTGSEYLDKLIFNYTMTNGSKDDIQNAIGNGGGGGGGPVDTRIAFTVVLGYNDDLMRAELERKGLSNDSMVEKLEVNS